MYKFSPWLRKEIPSIRPRPMLMRTLHQSDLGSIILRVLSPNVGSRHPREDGGLVMGGHLRGSEMVGGGPWSSGLIVCTSAGTSATMGLSGSRCPSNAPTFPTFLTRIYSTCCGPSNDVTIMPNLGLIIVIAHLRRVKWSFISLQLFWLPKGPLRG